MSVFVGIDVSKDRLDIYNLSTCEAWHLENTPKGMAELVERLAGATLVVMEATGGYQTLCQETLQEAEIAVCVVNPRRVRDFAKATGLLAKTDHLDAKVLAQFAATFQPMAQRPLSREVRQLQLLNAHRQDLVQLMTAQKNRLKQAKALGIQESIQRVLYCLKQEMTDVDAAIAECIRADETLSQKAQILNQVKGVGPVLCSLLLGNLPELGEIDEKRVAALAGVAPFNRDSGQFKGKRKIWGGRKEVRNALYMGANIARRFDPKMKAFFEQLVARGKAFKEALTACMRKLLVILNAKMRDHLLTIS